MNTNYYWVHGIMTELEKPFSLIKMLQFTHKRSQQQCLVGWSILTGHDSPAGQSNPAQWETVYQGTPPNQQLVSEVNQHCVLAHRRMEQQWVGRVTIYVKRFRANRISGTVPGHFTTKVLGWNKATAIQSLWTANRW